MGWNGSGTCTLTDGSYTSNWANNWRVNGAATITDTEFDALLTDVQTAVNACLTKNGENALTGNLNAGGYRLTSLGTPSASTDAGLYGKQVASGAYSSGDSEIQLTLQDSTRIDIDVSGLEAGTGGVNLTDAQTVAGIKTFSAISSLAHAKMNGPTTAKVTSVSSSSTPTIDSTATDFHFLTVNQNMVLNFTWPTASSDSQLGANYVKRGCILMRWSGASYTVGLNSTMTSALTDFELEGTHTTGSGEMSCLVYTYWYIGGSTYCQWAWVATP